MFKLNFNKIKITINTPILKEVIFTESDEPIMCVICQEPFTNETNVCELPCGHIYHPTCIKEWIKRNRSCPLCRDGDSKKFKGVFIENISQNEPLIFINEGEKDHFTQILYLLKESFYCKKDNGCMDWDLFCKKDYIFLGWDLFTKEYLINLYKIDEQIYIDNFGIEFAEKFPEKIDEFIKNYCELVC